MWLVVAMVALLAFLLVDFSKYSQKEPTDEEINSFGDNIDGNDLVAEDDLVETIPDFLQ